MVTVRPQTKAVSKLWFFRSPLQQKQNKDTDDVARSLLRHRTLTNSDTKRRPELCSLLTSGVLSNTSGKLSKECKAALPLCPEYFPDIFPVNYWKSLVLQKSRNNCHQ